MAIRTRSINETVIKNDNDWWGNDTRFTQGISTPENGGTRSGNIDKNIDDWGNAFEGDANNNNNNNNDTINAIKENNASNEFGDDDVFESTETTEQVEPSIDKKESTMKMKTMKQKIKNDILASKTKKHYDSDNWGD